MGNNLFTKRNIIAVIGLVIILFALVIGIIQVRNRQIFRSRATAGDVPGDYNNDGCVDERDYNRWKSSSNSKSKSAQEAYQIIRNNLWRTCSSSP